MSKEDNVAPLVLAAINAAATGEHAEIASAFEAIAPFNAGDVVAELFLWVEDLTSDVDLNALLAAVALPIPPRAPDIIAAMLAYDMQRLQAAMGDARPEKVFASLLALVAALKDARTRL